MTRRLVATAVVVGAVLGFVVAADPTTVGPWLIATFVVVTVASTIADLWEAAL